MAKLLRAAHGESGASAVEFAILAPVVFALLLGMFFGGIAFNHKLSMTHSAREAARFGGTLYFDPQGSGVPDQWLIDINNRAVDSAAGTLDTGEPGRSICVAYAGHDPDDATTSWTRRRVEDSSGVVYSAASCLTDSRGDEPRVQVRVRRDTQFNVFFYTSTITLTSEGIARYELVRQ